MNQPENGTRSTHGCMATLPADKAADGVKREVQVSRFEGDNYQVIVRSFWSGEQQAPTETVINLSKAGYETLSDTLMNFTLNMGLYQHKQS